MRRRIVSMILAVVSAAGLATSTGCGLVTKAATASPTPSPSASADPLEIIAAALVRSRVADSHLNGHSFDRCCGLLSVQADYGVATQVRLIIPQPIGVEMRVIGTDAYIAWDADVKKAKPWVKFNRERLRKQGLSSVDFVAPFIELLGGVVSAVATGTNTYKGGLDIQRAVTNAASDTAREFLTQMAKDAGDKLVIDYEVSLDDQGRISYFSAASTECTIAYGGAPLVVLPPAGQVRPATEADYARFR